jgi:hypothetical protein
MVLVLPVPLIQISPQYCHQVVYNPLSPQLIRPVFTHEYGYVLLPRLLFNS